MDPDVMPLHSSSPPPPCDAAAEEAGSSEEDEFGDFGGFSVVVSCSHPVYADWTASPSGTQPDRLGFKPPVEQSQPGSGALTNGYPEGDPEGDPEGGARSPMEETGFADFSVFGEQAAHPWCCGLAPQQGAEERRDGRAERGAARRREVVLDSEPRAREARPGRDRRPPQGAAAAAPGEEEEEEEEEELGKGRRCGFKSSQREPMHGDESVPRLPQTFGAYESASEDPASFSDDLSLDCPSADPEPNVSSLVSHDDQTDWDQTDDDNDEEELDDYRCSDLAVGFLPRTAGDEHRGVRGRGNLPPSDSFADFCSAPTQEVGGGGGDGSWAEFKDQRVVEEEEEQEEETRTQSRGPEEDGKEDQTRPGRPGGSGRSSCQGSLSGRVQQLLLACYPEVEVPPVGGEEEKEQGEEEEEEEEVVVPSLDALLHARQLPDSEEEEEEEEKEQEEEEEDEMPELCLRSNWIHQDLHDAVGLRFQWGGSHANRTLLRCLGVETQNIVFIGIKKQPVVVPDFASSLGTLEPTKDSPSAGPPEPSAGATQEAPPPEAWSLRGLGSSQDGTSPRRTPLFWGWM